MIEITQKETSSSELWALANKRIFVLTIIITPFIICTNSETISSLIEAANVTKFVICQTWIIHPRSICNRCASQTNPICPILVRVLLDEALFFLRFNVDQVSTKVSTEGDCRAMIQLVTTEIIRWAQVFEQRQSTCWKLFVGVKRKQKYSLFLR